MIAKNDYQIGLFNSDVGLILPDPARRGKLSAYFYEGQGEVREISTARLPEHETEYAQTVM